MCRQSSCFIIYCFIIYKFYFLILAHYNVKVSIKLSIKGLFHIFFIFISQLFRCGKEIYTINALLFAVIHK